MRTSFQSSCSRTQDYLLLAISSLRVELGGTKVRSLGIRELNVSTGFPSRQTEVPCALSLIVKVFARRLSRTFPQARRPASENLHTRRTFADTNLQAASA